LIKVSVRIRHHRLYVTGPARPITGTNRRSALVAGFAIFLALGVVLIVALANGTAHASPVPQPVRSAASSTTYIVTVAPGTAIEVGSNAFGYRDVVVGSGTWTMTVPTASNGMQWLGASPRPGLQPANAPTGYACSITRNGATVASDNRPGEYFCLAHN
jgi:hypothetical protein